jgi:hypothetical protein
MTESVKTNLIINNVTLKWVKLAEPTDNYSGDKKIYEVQASVPKARESELAKFGKTRPASKDDDSMVCINLSKNAFKKDGSEAAKVRVVDQNKLPLDPKVIGNGSVGNILVLQQPYEIKNPKTGKVTKSGTSTMLIAVQITKLVKYEPTSSVDFDVVETNGDAKEAFDDQF